jgi:biotin carboxylase
MTASGLLLVGSGDQAFREYSLRSISQRFPVALLSAHELSWQRPYVSWFAHADFDDRESLLLAARQLAADASVAGLLTWDERLVEACADIAQELDLPYSTPEAIRTCKDKSSLRTLLHEHAVSPVNFAVAHKLSCAARAAERIGYPLVVKPRGLGGSAGVVRVTRPDDLDEAFLNAAEAHIGPTVSAYAGVLMEEYLEGPEYSVDSLTVDGQTTPLVVAEKSVGLAPYFEETGHVVPPRPHPDLEAGLALVRQVHGLLRLDRVVTHTEFRLTPTGPRIIELNARLGGDLIPYLGTLALGVDLARLAAEVAMGEHPQPRCEATCAAAVRFIYPTADVTIRDVGLRRPAAEYPGLVEFRSIVAPGQLLLLPPDGYLSRLAYAIATGEDQDACEASLDRVVEDLVIDAEPVLKAPV